ncbi:MAG: hypothetical protein ACRD0H_22560, partial [Actinomycetes bacterium]
LHLSNVGHLSLSVDPRAVHAVASTLAQLGGVSSFRGRGSAGSLPDRFEQTAETAGVSGRGSTSAPWRAHGRPYSAEKSALADLADDSTSGDLPAEQTVR